MSPPTLEELFGLDLDANTYRRRALIKMYAHTSRQQECRPGFVSQVSIRKVVLHQVNCGTLLGVTFQVQENSLVLIVSIADGRVKRGRGLAKMCFP